MSYSEQLERETEQTRAELEDTLEELRQRITPGQMVDQLMDRAREGNAAAFLRNLGQQAVANPMPIAVMGAGLAWLMMSTGRPQPQVTQHRATDTTGRLVGASRSAAHDLGDAAHSAGSAVSNMAQQSKAKASEAVDKLSAGAGSAYDTATGGVRRAAAAVGSSATELSHDAARTTRQLVEFCKEQPLVLAGLGLAAGALIGALFPATRAEDRLMGETSDAVKRGAAAMTGDKSETAAAAEHRPAGSAAASPEPRRPSVKTTTEVLPLNRPDTRSPGAGMAPLGGPPETGRNPAAPERPA